MFVWTHQDPRGIDEGSNQALARCRDGAWGITEISESKGTREEDFLILVARSLFIRQVLLAVGNASVLSGLAPQNGRLSFNVEQGAWGAAGADVDHQNAQYILLRTWESLARAQGWTSGDAGNLTATSGKNASTSSNVVAIVAIVVGIVMLAAVIAFIVYNVDTLIDRQLARKAEGQEMMRAHAECEKMLEDHAVAEKSAGKPIPFSQAELAVMARLARLQDKVANSWTSTTSGGLSTGDTPKAKSWQDVAGDAFALVAFLGFGYFLIRREI